jgi:hypothetical protein
VIFPPPVGRCARSISSPARTTPSSSTRGGRTPSCAGSAWGGSRCGFSRARRTSSHPSLTPRCVVRCAS